MYFQQRATCFSLFGVPGPAQLCLTWWKIQSEVHCVFVSLSNYPTFKPKKSQIKIMPGRGRKLYSDIQSLICKGWALPSSLGGGRCLWASGCSLWHINSYLLPINFKQVSFSTNSEARNIVITMTTPQQRWFASREPGYTTTTVKTLYLHDLPCTHIVDGKRESNWGKSGLANVMHLVSRVLESGSDWLHSLGT